MHRAGGSEVLISALGVLSVSGVSGACTKALTASNKKEKREQGLRKRGPQGAGVWAGGYLIEFEKYLYTSSS